MSAPGQGPGAGAVVAFTFKEVAGFTERVQEGSVPAVFTAWFPGPESLALPGYGLTRAQAIVDLLRAGRDQVLADRLRGRS